MTLGLQMRFVYTFFSSSSTAPHPHLLLFRHTLPPSPISPVFSFSFILHFFLIILLTPSFHHILQILFSLLHLLSSYLLFLFPACPPVPSFPPSFIHSTPIPSVLPHLPPLFSPLQICSSLPPSFHMLLPLFLLPPSSTSALPSIFFFAPASSTSSSCPLLSCPLL